MLPWMTSHRVGMHCQGLVMAVAMLMLVDVAGGQVTSTWNSTTGNWSDAARWSTNPLFPNNGNGGNLYHAVIGGGTVTLDQAISVEDVSLSGGTITGANTLEILDDLIWTGGTFSGTGTTQIKDGTLSGPANKQLNQRTLEILGTVDLLAGRIVSTNYGTINIKNGGTFSMTGSHFGARDIQANMIVDSGGALINTGFQATEILGDLTNNGVVEAAANSTLFIDGGTGDGEFLIRSNATLFVELQNVADYQFTGPIVLDGGSIEILLFGGSGITFLLPALLSGNGTYQGYGGTLVNSTEIAPGFSVGSIDIDANYEQTPQGRLTIEVEGASFGEFDTLDISGTAELGGTLKVSLEPGHTVTPGDEIEFLTAAALNGSEFDDVVTENGQGIYFAPVYDLVSAAIYAYEIGDMNRDLSVDANDISSFALALNNPAEYSLQFGISGAGSGDANWDGILDFDDIEPFVALLPNTSIDEVIALIDNYSRVPEPGSLRLLLCFVAVLVVNRR